MDLIAQCITARDAFESARKHDSHKRNDWDHVKDDIMRDALFYKFSKNPKLKETLKTTTGDLVEASPIDPYWGYGHDKRGKNMLGVLLMELRKKL